MEVEISSRDMTPEELAEGGDNAQGRGILGNNRHAEAPLQSPMTRSLPNLQPASFQIPRLQRQSAFGSSLSLSLDIIGEVDMPGPQAHAEPRAGQEEILASSTALCATLAKSYAATLSDRSSAKVVPCKLCGIFELERPPKALFDWLPSADGLLVDHKQKSVSKLQLTFSRLAATANTARESTWTRSCGEGTSANRRSASVPSLHHHSPPWLTRALH